MSQKRKLENETMEDVLVNKEFHGSIIKIINKTIDERRGQDAREIAKQLRDDIDKMVSERVKYHFTVLANFILDQFKT